MAKRTQPKTTRLKLLSALMPFLGFGLGGVSQAIKAEDSVQEFWDSTKLSGDIRSYYFSRDYTNPAKTAQYAYAVGGDLNLLTGSFWNGFRIGATLYTAQPLGLNSDNPQRLDNTLPGTALAALGQAYLQYTLDNFLVRAGDQLINTPWLNAADSRMIPATYRGFFSSWMPTKQWTFSALRIYAFKSRVSNDFSATNIYNPANQGMAIAKLGTNKGAQAIGINYKTAAISGQVWGYQFFDFAKLGYGDIQYTWVNKANIQPLLAAQFLLETADGANSLNQLSMGKANSIGYGALMGVEMPYAKITLAYNRLVANSQAFNHGDVISPYTYTSDPFYTTSMIAGLVDKTAGQAWKIAGTLYALDKQLQFTTSFAQYHTQPYMANTAETDMDINYFFKKSPCKWLRGLSIRNRLGILSGDPSRGRFYYNRVMLQYSF